MTIDIDLPANSVVKLSNRAKADGVSIDDVIQKILESWVAPTADEECKSTSN